MDERILIIKLRMMGDAIISTPTIRALKEFYPDSYLAVLTTPSAAEVLKFNPFINEIFIYNKKEMGNIRSNISFLSMIRSRKFNVVVNLHASFRSALIAFLSGAKRRVVHNHSGTNFFSNVQILAKKESKSAVERDLDTADALNIAIKSKNVEMFLSQEEESFGKNYIRNIIDANERNLKIIGINPGARRMEKQWQREKYAKLADLIAGKYKSKILIFSGPQEEYIGDEIIGKMAGPSIHVKNLNIRQVASIMKQCDLYIGNDSGPFHIAVALSVPTIAVFGPEKPREWHPYSGSHIVLYNENIKSIAVEDVFNKVMELLDKKIC